MNTSIVPLKQLWISLLIVGTGGCVMSPKEAILPQTGPTMKDVYAQHFEGRRAGSSDAATEPNTAPSMGRARRLGDAMTDLNGYTRESYNETKRVFTRLPNPDLVMYVFPHLSGGEGSPIPGYSTAFSFYETVHYALPGEVEE